MVSPTEPVPSTGSPLTATVPARRFVRRRALAVPLPSGETALATRAVEVVRARSTRAPARWLLPGFALDVDVVRRQLGPLHDLRMLVASYERESARLAAIRRLAADPAAPPPPLDPLEAAYTIRWLELADGGVPLPPWASFVGGEADAPG